MRGRGASGGPAEGVRGAWVVLPCAGALQPTLDFLVERLGFRLERISPADDPREAELSGHGLRVLVRRAPVGEGGEGGEGGAPPGTLRLACDDPESLGGGARELVAPNGSRIELVAPTDALPVSSPAPAELAVGRARDGGWVPGRAGMLYRDLVPGRLGGRLVASRIRIEAGGPVPDHVHFHAVRFQAIFCAKGWVRLVYEDQGPPFVLAEGDCVLQPPRIRHRVLESSPGLEVIEVASPAEHDTYLDHELELPTRHARPERDFGGQRFARHEAARAAWRPWRGGLEEKVTGIAAATGGLAGARVVRAAEARPAGDAAAPAREHPDETLFACVLAGGLALEGAPAGPLRLEAGDAVAAPPGVDLALAGWSDDLELLEVRLRSEG